MENVVCPVCGEDILFDSDNDVILCDECGSQLDVWQEEEGGIWYVALQ